MWVFPFFGQWHIQFRISLYLYVMLFCCLGLFNFVLGTKISDLYKYFLLRFNFCTLKCYLTRMQKKHFCKAIITIFILEYIVIFNFMILRAFCFEVLRRTIRLYYFSCKHLLVIFETNISISFPMVLQSQGFR